MIRKSGHRFFRKDHAPLKIRRHRSPRRTHPAGRIPRYDRLKADFSPRAVRSIRNLHHQRWLSRVASGASRQTRIIVRGAVDGAPLVCGLRRARSAIGVRLIASFPPAGPARSGRARFRASPGIRVSRSGVRRAVLDEPTLRATKNPPGAVAREGLQTSRLPVLLSGKTPPMS